MRYDNITRAAFLKRPNRFIAEVDIDGHKEWLSAQDYDMVIPEYTYGDSRIDFYMERGGKR